MPPALQIVIQKKFPLGLALGLLVPNEVVPTHIFEAQFGFSSMASKVPLPVPFRSRTRFLRLPASIATPNRCFAGLVALTSLKVPLTMSPDSVFALAGRVPGEQGAPVGPTA
jgi:hypothetical protein